jgi:hypothetical protein
MTRSARRREISRFNSSVKYFGEPAVQLAPDIGLVQQHRDHLALPWPGRPCRDNRQLGRLCIEAKAPALIFVGTTGAGLSGGNGITLDSCHPPHLDAVAARFARYWGHFWSVDKAHPRRALLTNN